MMREQIEDLLPRIQDKESGFDCQNRKRHLRTHRNCFIGSEAVDWLLANTELTERSHAVELGCMLQRTGIFTTVDGVNSFGDDKTFYRFIDCAAIREELKQLHESIEFETEKVQTAKKRSTRWLRLDFAKGLIVQTRRNHSRAKTFNAAQDLCSVLKSRTFSRKLILIWKCCKPTKYFFTSCLHRQRFYEGAWSVIAQNNKLPHTLNIFSSSWNLGESVPPADLSSWIPVGSYDLYVVGVQEANFGGDATPDSPSTRAESDPRPITSSSSSATLPRDGSSERRWFEQLDQHLGDEYEMLSGHSLWAIRIVAFVRRSLRPFIQRLQTATVATGIANVAGNKGGVAIAFQILETKFCFISCHLAAHQAKVDDRNADYFNIVRGLKIGARGVDLTTEFHNVLWMGDLNYRIDLPRDAVLALVGKRDWTTLARSDQLCHEKRHNRCFLQFHEANIFFPPTYRYLRGIYPRVYDEAKLRIPAWCDRIMYRTLPDVPFDQTNYCSADTIVSSDHSPVYATFSSEIHSPPLSSGWEAPPVEILLGELVATNLPKEMQPFLRIVAKFLPPVALTSPSASKGTTVGWGQAAVPMLIPYVSEIEYLTSVHLHLFLCEEKGDHIGEAVVSLSQAAGPDPHPFTATLQRNEMPLGFLKGTLHIRRLGEHRAAAALGLLLPPNKASKYLS